MDSARLDSILFCVCFKCRLSFQLLLLLLLLLHITFDYYLDVLFICHVEFPLGNWVLCGAGRAEEGKGKGKGQSWGNFVSVSNYQRNAAIVACTWILEQIWLHLPDKIDLLKSFFIAPEKKTEEGRERGERYTEKAKVQRGFLPEREHWD